MNHHDFDRGLDADIALDRAITTLAPVSDADVAALITVDARLALTALAGADRSPSALPLCHSSLGSTYSAPSSTPAGLSGYGSPFLGNTRSPSRLKWRMPTTRPCT